MPHVISRDGTRIAYERTGSGPALVMVNGAFGYREFSGDRPFAALLSDDFTVYSYDRRGRGESADTAPFAIEREIEDIEALIVAAGGSAFLYGISSGAALALRAAAHLGPGKVRKLALYEPPFGAVVGGAKRNFGEEKKHIDAQIAQGRRSDAVAQFMSGLGVPPEAIEGMKQSPDWKVMVGVAHTLAYDYAALGDGSLPFEVAAQATMPTLVMDGGKTEWDFMHRTADALARAIPHAERRTLPDQTHDVSPDALAPVLKEFFRSSSANPPLAREMEQPARKP